MPTVAEYPKTELNSRWPPVSWSTTFTARSVPSAQSSASIRRVRAKARHSTANTTANAMPNVQ